MPKTTELAITPVPDYWESYDLRRAADARRNAENEPEEPPRYHCRRIFPGGRRCGSPALRGEPFCYFHHTTRKPVPNPEARRKRRYAFTLPVLEDRSSVRQAIAVVLERIAANEIDPRRAGLLLYGLQTAARNLPEERTGAENDWDAPAPPVEEIVVDAKYGVLAPVAEIGSLVHREKGPAELMLEEMEREFGTADSPRPERARSTSDSAGWPRTPAVTREGNDASRTVRVDDDADAKAELPVQT